MIHTTIPFLKMKNIFMSIVACIFMIVLCPSYSFSEGVIFIHGKAGDDFTAGWPNGRYWANCDLQNKIYLIEGIDMGVYFLANELMGGSLGKSEKKILNTHLDARIVPGFKMSEFVKEIDTFYSDKTNIRIPIPYALIYVYKKFHGVDQAVLYDNLTNLRKLWNSIKPSQSE